MSKKTNCIGKPEQKPHFKTPPVVSKAPVTRYFVDVAKDDSVFAQVVLAQRGFRCRDIHEENGQTVRITIEDQTLRRGHSGHLRSGCGECEVNRAGKSAVPYLNETAPDSRGVPSRMLIAPAPTMFFSSEILR